VNTSSKETCKPIHTAVVAHWAMPVPPILCSYCNRLLVYKWASDISEYDILTVYATL
jgi:hypothetical protein